MDDFFDGYGKWIILFFGTLGVILIIICVSCCYVKAKRDRAEMIKNIWIIARFQEAIDKQLL